MRSFSKSAFRFDFVHVIERVKEWLLEHERGSFESRNEGFPDACWMFFLLEFGRKRILLAVYETKDVQFSRFFFLPLCSSGRIDKKDTKLTFFFDGFASNVLPVLFHAAFPNPAIGLRSRWVNLRCIGNLLRLRYVSWNATSSFGTKHDVCWRHAKAEVLTRFLTAILQGETFTIYFNPKVNGILNAESSIAFNGGFNGPFMCGGVPRLMSKRDRGPACDPLYSIRLNVPKHAVWLEFSFTDGTSWDEGYKLRFLVPESFRGQNLDFFNKELRREMSEEDACYQAIFPDPVPEPDSHFLGGSMSIGMSCDLDVVSGCTDPDSPNYDPLATIDDATCEEDF